MIKLISIFVLLSISVTAQDKLYMYDTAITCEIINSGIIDSKLYRIDNGKIQIIPNGIKKYGIQELIVNGKSYYISNELATLVNKVIKKKKCKDISIIPLTNDNDKTIITRD